jgi:hypothetical protein
MLKGPSSEPEATTATRRFPPLATQPSNSRLEPMPTFGRRPNQDFRTPRKARRLPTRRNDRGSHRAAGRGCEVSWK